MSDHSLLGPMDFDFESCFEYQDPRSCFSSVAQSARLRGSSKVGGVHVPRGYWPSNINVKSRDAQDAITCNVNVCHILSA
jgi:hypothetical protein